MLDVVVERKRLADLVGRSAAGDHLRQVGACACAL
jgi:hypothetical protein